MTKILYLLLFLLASAQALAQEDCPPIPPESMALVTALQVPSCIQQNLVDRQVRLSQLIEFRSLNSLSPPQGEEPVCGACKTDFQTRVTPNGLTRDQKKDAFFLTAYKELEKSLSSIAIDIVSVRSTWTTGSRFNQSLRACDTRRISQKLASCRSSFQNAFATKNLPDRIGSEIAALITSNQSGINGILERPEATRSCPISDIDSSNLKQQLLEETITPQMIAQIVSVQAETPAQLQGRLSQVLGDEAFALLQDHPVIRSMLLEPSAFLSTMRSLSNISDRVALKNSLRATLHSPAAGDRIDAANAKKCNDTIDSFTNALCSPNFERGNISLGPFHNIKKHSETGDVAISESDVTANEIDYRNNSVAFDFCENSTSNKISLGDTLVAMNSWMPTEERNSNLRRYSAEKYNKSYGDLRQAMCAFHPASTCNEDTDACRLYKRFKAEPSTPERRIAASSDSNVDRVLQALIGNPATISPRAKEVLIAEGIIPQANGQLVERPSVPERQPDYLANVANGTITPDNGGGRTVSPQPGNRTRQGGSQTAQQAQLAQPQGSSVAQADQQSAVTDEDDSIDEEEVERDLRDRLRRASEQQGQNGPQPQSRPRQRRMAGRSDSSDQNRLPASLPTAPGQIAPQAPTVSGGSAPAAPTTRDAALAPDTSAQTRSQKQMNAALANMNGVIDGGSGDAAGTTGPATDGSSQPGSSTVALTISGDIRTNLQRMLTGSDTNAENLRELLRQQRPFVIQLNNSVFDVQYVNGTFTVSARSRESTSIASTLQGVFNESGRNLPPSRTNTLNQLQQTVRN